MKTFRVAAFTCICGAALSAARPTYAKQSFQIGQATSPQFGVFIGKRRLANEPVELGPEAQANFQALNTGRPSQSRFYGTSSHHRSANEVESKTKKIRKLKKPLAAEEANERESAVPVSATVSPRVGDQKPLLEKVENVGQERSRACLSDLNVRWSPATIPTILDHLKRIKGHLSKDRDGVPSLSSDGAHVEARNDDDDIYLALRAFSDALGSLD